MDLPIKNRIEAGRALAMEMEAYLDYENLLILGLPRGGVPVAYQMAVKLGAQLDLMLVRKLGTPGHAELAMGAIASGGIRVLNDDIIASLDISGDEIDQIATGEQKELERRELAYRGDHPRPEIEGRVVVLVDDGIATGATMRAAIAALRKQHPASIVVAVPVAPAETIEILRNEADEVVCLANPAPFIAIGKWYEDFSQVSDAEVKKLLIKSWAE
ncbi:MAG: phosphoribosyltransferase [Gammaproteobacteria bacterium]|nr:phosphoribosyltransferase [Gammaproteobacteria bacterium]